MPQLFHRLFRIVPGEGPKLVAFMLFAALLQAGITIGISASDSLFLIHLGVEKLPLIYIILPLVMAVYAPIFAFLQTRLGMVNMFRLTLCLLIAGGVFFGLSPNFVPVGSPWLLYAMKLYQGLWFIALYTLFWNFTDDFFTILDSKRLYGLISAGGALGAGAGALLVAAATTYLQPARLFLAWAILAALALPALGSLCRRFPRIDADETLEEESRSATGLLRFVLSTFRSSRFAVALTAICFSMVFLSGFLEYLAFGVFSQRHSAAELARLLGFLHAIANGANLVISLVLFNRIVSGFGVRNTALILPLSYLVAFLLLYLHGGMLGALVAFYAFQTLMVSVEYNNINLLFNALPGRVKKQLRTFIEASGEPCATALAGIFLLTWAQGIGESGLAAAGLLGSLVAIGIALILRRDYAGALAQNLKRDWLDFSRTARVWARDLKEEDRSYLRQLATKSESRDTRIFAAELLGCMDDPHTSEILLGIVSSAPSSEAERLRPAIVRMLREGDSATMAQILLWLEARDGPDNPALLEEFAGTGLLPVRQLHVWSRSSVPSHRALAAAAQWSSSKLEDAQQALATVASLLQGDSEARRWGIRALGCLRHGSHARELLRRLSEEKQELRVEILRALHRLAGPETSFIARELIPLLSEAQAEERRLILGITARCGDSAAAGEILRTEVYLSPSEIRELEDIILALGLKSVPGLIHHLRNEALSPASRSTAARALARLSQPQLELIVDELISRELDRASESKHARQFILAEDPSKASDGLLLLANLHEERALESRDFILRLLNLSGRMADFDLIRASLSFTGSKDHANAVETIAQSCPRRLFDRLLPLLDPDRNDSATKGAYSLSSLLDRACQSPSVLEAGAALIAWRELGLADPDERLRAAVSGRPASPQSRRLAELEPTLSAEQMPSLRRTAALLRTTIFSDSRASIVDYLALRSSVRTYAKGDRMFSPDEPSEQLHVLLAGSAISETGRQPKSLGPGTCCNEQILFGRDHVSELTLSHGCTALCIHHDVLARAMELFPELGIRLFRLKSHQSE